MRVRFGTVPKTARAHEHFRPRFGLLDFGPGVTELTVTVPLCSPPWQGGSGPGEPHHRATPTATTTATSGDITRGGGDGSSSALTFDVALKAPVFEDEDDANGDDYDDHGQRVSSSIPRAAWSVGLVCGCATVGVRNLEPTHLPRVVGEVESPQLRSLLRAAGLRRASAPLFDLGVRCLDDAVRERGEGRGVEVKG